MSTKSSMSPRTRQLYNIRRSQDRPRPSFGNASSPLVTLSECIEHVHGSDTEENASNRSANNDDNASDATDITVPSPDDNGPTSTHSLTNNSTTATRPSPPTRLAARPAFTSGKARSKPIPTAHAPGPLAHPPDDWDAPFMAGSLRQPV